MSGLFRVLWLLLWCLVGASTGCAFMPQDAVPFDPPPSYRAVWDSAQACTGRRGEFGRLRFFVIEGTSFEGQSGKPSSGSWEGDNIFVAETYQFHPMVVKHEMIHELLDDGGHPQVPFARPCRATWATYDGPWALE